MDFHADAIRQAGRVRRHDVRPDATDRGPTGGEDATGLTRQPDSAGATPSAVDECGRRLRFRLSGDAVTRFGNQL